MTRRSRDDVAEQDLSDIESGHIAHRCFSCGHQQIVIRKVYHNEVGNAISTKTKTGVCGNKECFRWHDLRLTPSWVRDDELIPGVQLPGATRSGALEYSPEL